MPEVQAKLPHLATIQHGGNVSDIFAINEGHPISLKHRNFSDLGGF